MCNYTYDLNPAQSPPVTTLNTGYTTSGHLRFSFSRLAGMIPEHYATGGRFCRRLCSTILAGFCRYYVVDTKGVCTHPSWTRCSPGASVITLSLWAVDCIRLSIEKSLLGSTKIICTSRMTCLPAHLWTSSLRVIIREHMTYKTKASLSEYSYRPVLVSSNLRSSSFLYWRGTDRYLPLDVVKRAYYPVTD